MNLLLDTNALYYYYGREKLELTKDPKVDITRLNTILEDQDNLVSISTITIIEFLVRYRKKLTLIKDVLRFLVIKRIDIIHLGIADFSIYDIQKFIRASDSIIEMKLKSYLKEKIKIEAGFATSILLLLLKIYLNSYLEREERINIHFKALPERERNKRKSELLSLLLSNDIQESLKSCNSTFTKVLRKGYAIEKEGRFIKDAFNNVLYINYAVYSCFTEFFIKNYDTMEFTDHQLRIELQEIVTKITNFNFIENRPDYASNGIMKNIKDFKKNRQVVFIDRHRLILLTIGKRTVSFLLDKLNTLHVYL